MSQETGAGVGAEFAAVLAGCRSAQRRLLDTVDGLEPADLDRPSLLPDWRVAHLLTHLARNADSNTRMLGAAARGAHVEQYEGGHEQRARDIETGAQRPGAAVLADVREATARLEEAWDAMPADAWDGYGLSMGRPWPCRQIVFHRWREVELHHVDLGLGYSPADWPDEYLALELPVALAQLPRRLDDAGRRAMFAWLVGRRPELGAVDLAPWQSVRYGAGGPFAPRTDA